MRKALKIGIETLSRGDVQIIAIPCNVVHLYYDQMQAMTEYTHFTYCERNDGSDGQYPF